MVVLGGLLVKNFFENFSWIMLSYAFSYIIVIYRSNFSQYFPSGGITLFQ